MAKEPISVRILLVSPNSQSCNFLCEQTRQLAITVDICSDSQSAVKRLCRAKFEGVIVDFELGDEGLALLETLRDMTSHRHAILYAIVTTAEQAAVAFRANANFVLQQPFVAGSVSRTLRAAYPMMFRERRRSYRHTIEARTLVKPQGAEEFWANSVNISETGMAISTSATLQIGERVRLELDLPGFSDAFTVSGEICWNTNGRAGMRFVQMPATIAERLQFWISERMSELVPTC